MEYKYQTHYYWLEIGGYVIEFYRNHNDEVNVQTKDIGNVVKGVSLNLQGEQNSIDSPITKTSLSISLVDASDINDGKMNGPWDFFARAGEKEWWVTIERESDGLYIWSGYITPDSFSEDLTYHGVCSITARDNIGQLQNLDFDAEGDADAMISMRDLVDAAWLKIDNKMRLEWADESCWIKTGERTPAYDTYLNISAFKGMSWYEALESVLYAYGAVLRYTGHDSFVIAPLRWMPSFGHAYSEMGFGQPKFQSGVTREFFPAAKSIEENIKYELEEGMTLNPIEGFTGATKTYPCEVGVVSLTGEIVSYKNSGYVNPITGNSNKGWDNDQNTSLFFSPRIYEVDSVVMQKRLESTIRSYQYIAANNTDSRSVSYRLFFNVDDVVLSIKLGTPIGIHASGNNSGRIGIATTTNLRKATYVIAITNNEQGSDTYYYRGGGIWATTYSEIEQEFEYTAPTNEISLGIYGTSALPSGRSQLELSIIKLNFVKAAPDSYGAGYSFNGLYAAIGEISLNRARTTFLCSENHIKTKYNDTNNLILSRDPKLAPAVDPVVFPSYIKNGIFEKLDYQILPTKSWEIIEGQYSQLAVAIHMQLLAYHTQPNEVLNGTILNAPEDFLRTIYLWGYHQEHILLSGSLNLLNGHIEGAVLREFLRYEDVWQGATIPEFKEEQTNK